MMNEPSLIGPDEKLIWSGKPDPFCYAIRKGIAPVTWGVVVLAFVVLVQSATTRTKPAPDPIPGVMVLIALGAVLSPVYYFVRAKFTDYAISNRRAVVKSSFLSPLRVAVPFDQIDSVEVSSSVGKVGHVLFLDSGAHNFSRRGPFRRRDGFIAIADADHAGALLNAAVKQAATGRVTAGTAT